jgi:hypothetical protein
VGMSARLIAIVAAAGWVGLAVLLALPVVRSSDSEPVLPDAGPPAASLRETTANGLIEAKVFLLPNLGYRLDILVSQEPGAPPPRVIRPTVILEMDGMDMGRSRPSLYLAGVGEFRAEGTFAMPGRWRFRVGFKEELFDLEVTTPPSGERAPASGATGSSFGHLLGHLSGGWL